MSRLCRQLATKLGLAVALEQLKLSNFFQALARVNVDVAHLNTYLQAVYPLTNEQRNEEKRPVCWNRVTELFEIGDTPNLAPSHTLWGAYKAVTRYEDYRQANEAGAGSSPQQSAVKKIARTVRAHRSLLLNYFSSPWGVIEELNNKAKVTMRRSCGFRIFRILELAVYHSLGKRREAELTHDFFISSNESFL